MRFTAILLLALSLIGTSCARCYRDVTMYHTSGKAKPIVAFLPVIDHTHNTKYNWDLSTELTNEIRARFMDATDIYLLREETGNKSIALELAKAAPNEISKAMISDLHRAEFIVVAEFIDQREIPYGLKKANEKKSHQVEVGANLSMDMRLKVVDVRGNSPKVILQEVVHIDHDISKPYLHTDYKRNGWGTDGFVNTPMGMAHSKLAREIVAHVEGYVAAS